MNARRVVSVNESGHVVGQDHHRAKFSDHDIWLILELRAAGLSYRQIADKFDTTKATIYDFVKGRRRAQIPMGQKMLAHSKPRYRFKPAHVDEFDAVCIGG